MKRLFASLSKLVFNALYKAACLSCSERRNEVLFLSRQADEPSYDYQELARQFEEAGWVARIHVRKLSRRSLAPYALHVLKEIVFLSRCKVAVLDRYDPVIGLLDFKCEPASIGQVLENTMHYEFPCEPVVIQIWHAFGAFKKFGHQSVGTREGHSRETFDAFGIHRNYSWIVCSGEGCRKAFAEAFSYPIERIVVARRPEYDKLVKLRERLACERTSCEDKPMVLFAPTLRKSEESAHPFRDLYERRSLLEREVDAKLIWSFHPLESGLPAPGDVSAALLDADIVVTDYSSIVYEAYLLGKKVLFYVPDIESYRTSPGLNADPCYFGSGLIALSETAVIALLRLAIGGEYDQRQIETFAADAFDVSAMSIAEMLMLSGGVERANGTYCC